MKLASLTFLTLFFVAFSVNADLVTETILDADFTSPTYADGAVNGQPGFIETQAGYIVSDAGGIGILSDNSGAFLRAQFGDNRLESATVAVGDMIIVQALDLNITADPGNQTMVFGLSSGGSGGAAQMTLGGQITTDGTNLFVENGAFGVDLANRVDTGFNIGDTFDYSIKMTAESAGAINAATFRVDHMVNGTSIYNQTGQTTGTFNAATSTTLAAFIQDQGGTNYNTSQLTFSTISGVPEPGSLVFLGIVGVATVVRRRR